ncbi:DUF1947 domain-containing protein [Candidatus Woesearchaeota archaeon]|nr:DUF1947 domain-containing protein [Candidatus Woesearchaeota archaeon]
MKRKTISKSEIKDLNDKLNPYGISFDKKLNMQYVETEDVKGYLIDKDLVAFVYKDTIVPTLKYILGNKITIPFVEVDVPAVKFLINGADIMRPGIKHIDSFGENSIILVRDELHKKPICLAKTLKNSEDLKNMDKGKSLENIHYIGDKIWSFAI